RRRRRPSGNVLVHSLLGIDAAPSLYWTVAFLTTFIALLPATVAMGGTLAAAENWYRHLTEKPDQIGLVYLINTIGAAGGTMLVPFILMPRFGFSFSMMILLLLNLMVAACAFVAIFRAPKLSAAVPNGHKQTYVRKKSLWFRLFGAGFLGIGFEVLGVRVMAQIFEGTIYSFSATLCIFLLGSAIGGLIYHLTRGRWRVGQRQSYLVLGLSFSVLGGIAVLSHAQPMYRAVRKFLGNDPLDVLGAELLLALPIYGVACTLMGALFCHFTAQAKTERGGVGWALSANTLGGMIAPAVIALLAIPALGIKWTGVCLAFGYLALLPRPLPVPRWVPLLPLAAAGLLPAIIQVVTLRPGERIIAYNDGSVASVAVTERRSERNLRVDNRFQMGGTGRTALRVQRVQAHLPLLLHDSPQRVLMLGVATGITSGAALQHPGVSIDGVELTPGVLDVLPSFKYFNRDLKESDRVQLYNADARRFVRMSNDSYDVIIGDLFQPARDGAGFLYTIEHFNAVRERLSQQGLFCQWLPLYQMDEQLVRIIVKTFTESFPHTEAWLGSFGLKYPVLALIGSESFRQLNIENLLERITVPTIRGDLSLAAIRKPVQLLGHYLADDQALREFSVGAPMNTDDFPRVLFEAPSFTFLRGQPGYLTLAALTKAFASAGLSLPTQSDELTHQVQKYMLARQDYLSGQMSLSEERQEESIEHLFSALDKSADFTLAYAQLVNVARQVEKNDSKKAESILSRLAKSYPHLRQAR
ncbi:MAG: fused MFS/spermidine synthase, partial [Pseudomonadota bacterium]